MSLGNRKQGSWQQSRYQINTFTSYCLMIYHCITRYSCFHQGTLLKSCFFLVSYADSVYCQACQGIFTEMPIMQCRFLMAVQYFGQLRFIFLNGCHKYTLTCIRLFTTIANHHAATAKSCKHSKASIRKGATLHIWHQWETVIGTSSICTSPLTIINDSI